MMVGAAHAAVDDLSLGKIGADMRTVGALDDRLTFRAPIDDYSRAEKIPPDDHPGTKLRCQHQRVPVLQISAVVLAPVLTAEMARGNGSRSVCWRFGRIDHAAVPSYWCRRRSERPTSLTIFFIHRFK